MKASRWTILVAAAAMGAPRLALAQSSPASDTQSVALADGAPPPTAEDAAPPDGGDGPRHGPREPRGPEGDRPPRGPWMHHGPMHLEKGAFLGISAVPVDPALRAQLKLPKGAGLAVEFVVPESPAAAAGLKEFDVLLKLDDQLLINPEQLAVLVRQHKAEDQISLSIVREGQPQTVQVKLVEKELPPLDDHPFMEGGPPAMGRHGPAHPGGEDGPGGPGMRRFGMMPHEWPTSAPANLESTVTWINGEQTITVHTKDGHRTVSVKDKQGASVFEGPIDSEEERQKLPPEVAKQLHQMRAGGMMGFPPHPPHHPGAGPEGGPDDGPGDGRHPPQP